MMTILSLFNDADALTYNNIQLCTGTYNSQDLSLTFYKAIEDTYLKQALFSLVASKLLLKEPANQIINPQDTFSVNQQFTSKTLRLKIPTLNYTEKQ
jgi:hypothetical protein